MSYAVKAIKFLRGLTIPEGRMAGKRLRLPKYQQAFVRGALAPENMVGVLSIGRGNGKTGLAAGLALGSIMGVWDSQPRREVILAARNRDQASIAFSFMRGFLDGLPDEQREKFKIRRGAKLEIEFEDNGGGLARCIAADARSILGGAPILAILDERAAWQPDKGDQLESALLSGLGKRGGKALIISTSAPDDANTFSRWLDNPPPGTYVQEHRPPPGLPADDLESLLIANPGSREGIGASPEWLVAQARRAIARGGSALSSFRNLNRNERVCDDSRSVLVTTDEWLRCEVETLPPREGECVLGVDLGGSRSMSAWALYWPRSGRIEAGGAFPATPGLRDRGESDGVGSRYVEMQQRGELETVGENIVELGQWLASVARRVEGQSLACIVGDRFRHAEFCEALQKANIRAPFIPRGQGFRDGSEDIERFRSALFDGRVKSAQSLLLRSAFADAITIIDDAGNHKLTKARSNGRIDPACAAILAVGEGMRRAARPAKQARAALWV
jgi:phage terminase large subunit-like protein